MPLILKLPIGGWKEQTYYWIKVQLFESNPPFPAIFYSGFLNGKDGQPGGYACKLSETDDYAVEFQNLYSIEVLSEIGKPTDDWQQRAIAVEKEIEILQGANKLHAESFGKQELEIQLLRAAKERAEQSLDLAKREIERLKEEVKTVETIWGTEARKFDAILKAYQTVLYYRPHPQSWWDDTMEPESERKYNQAMNDVHDFEKPVSHGTPDTKDK